MQTPFFIIIKSPENPNTDVNRRHQGVKSLKNFIHYCLATPTFHTHFSHDYPKLTLPPSLKKGSHIAKTLKDLQLLTRAMKLVLSYLR